MRVIHWNSFTHSTPKPFKCKFIPRSSKAVEHIRLSNELFSSPEWGVDYLVWIEVHLLYLNAWAHHVWWCYALFHLVRRMCRSRVKNIPVKMFLCVLRLDKCLNAWMHVYIWVYFQWTRRIPKKHDYVSLTFCIRIRISLSSYLRSEY